MLLASLTHPVSPRLAAAVVASMGLVQHAAGQSLEREPSLEARVWLDRGEEPVLQRGEQVRVYYRTSDDAYAAIFRIDTDGVVTMVFPQHPGAMAPVRGGRDYRLLFPRAPVWSVDEDPGVGYFFIVASPEPLDFSAFTYDERFGWDLGGVGRVVYEDPYVAIDTYVAQLIRNWEAVPYALDFLTYHVGSTHSYPRFLCYDCHAYRPYASWNPYTVTCSSFRVVIWDDPYFYPAYRYSGVDIVVARPVRTFPRYEVVTRVAGDIGVQPIVRARAAPARRVEFKDAPSVASPVGAPVRRTAALAQAPQPSSGPRALPQEAPPRAGQQVPDSAAARPTLQRRPSGSLPARTPPASTTPARPGATPTPVTPTRPTPGASGEPAREPAGSTRPQASPSGASRATPQAAPERPTTRAVPSAGARETPRAPRASPPASATSRPTPSRPAPSTGSARPEPREPAARPAPQPSRPPTGAQPATREPAPRPTVRSRPADPD